MTKKNLPFLLIIFIIALGAIYFQLKSNYGTTPATHLKSPQHEFRGRRVAGLTPGQEESELKNLQVSNKISKDWKEKVEQAISLQGGPELIETEIIPEDSYIWVFDGTALYVESVLIKLINSRSESTKFRALIDSDTGKILRTWDHPIIDPANPRKSKGIKIDPRYHGN